MPMARRKNTLAICKTRSLFIAVLLFPFPFQRMSRLEFLLAWLWWRRPNEDGPCRVLRRKHHHSTPPSPVHLLVESSIPPQGRSQERNPDEHVWPKSCQVGRSTQGRSPASH